MKRILIIAIIFLIFYLNINNTIGKENTNDNTNDLSVVNSNLQNIRLNIRLNTLARLARMRSLSACIVKNNTLVWSNAFGFADTHNFQKATTDTLYMAGSISKVITATALMQLYENESYNFDLDDNVSKWLPFDLKNPNFPDINITFRMLLAHQSSLLGHTTPQHYLFSNRSFSNLSDLILPNGSEYSSYYWGDYQPGQRGNYSNLGYVVIGYIIERMTGLSFEDYCQKNIFKPLEMNHSSFTFKNINKSNLAAPYEWQGIFFRGDKYDYNFIEPCGGLYTTPEDLSHLLIAHLKGGDWNGVEILKKSTLEMMHTIQYPNILFNLSFYYGLGWSIWQDTDNVSIKMGHNGDIPGYHSRMHTLISENTTIIYFFNNDIHPRILFPRLSSFILEYRQYQIEKLLYQMAEKL